jgi:hypothetical protein
MGLTKIRTPHDCCQGCLNITAPESFIKIGTVEVRFFYTCPFCQSHWGCSFLESFLEVE